MLPAGVVAESLPGASPWRPRPPGPGTGSRSRTTVGDVLDVQYEDGDVAYFDPPYTKRQYAAYYHILETIAAG